MANMRKYQDWACVVNVPEGQDVEIALSAYPERLKTYLTGLMTYNPWGLSRFAYVLNVHAGEAEPITGRVKRDHMHIVLHFEQGVTLTTCIQMLTTALSVEGEALPNECVSADHSRNLCACVRYLFHLDNPEKPLYPISLGVGSSDWWLPFVDKKDVVGEICEHIAEGWRVSDFIVRYGRSWWLSNRLIVLDLLRDFSLKAIEDGKDEAGRGLPNF